ncbi:MAG: hypothetical protein H6754_02910 [Candidatus Omnitrophica bacterium]|nr:hypothetical protein [Candidatus Omnitrophota bacterium]
MSSPRKNIDSVLIFIGLVIILWIFSFRVFLSREAPLISDAVSFYDHLKFYIDNISRGVYPLWDPLWSCGSPNEFFLRRIGPFNPFLLLIIIPYKLGLSYWVAFAAFITFYFFLGMIGFYKLALEVSKDKSLAFVAFALLSFSSLGTRVFDSYLMMFMSPMIWFFYFLLIFGRSGKTSAVLGMVFCLMLLMTTYIPFYFIVLFLSFLVFYIPIFLPETKDFLLRLGRFFCGHPWIFILSLIAVGLSCVPGILFFKAAGQGIFAMPLRHFDATAQHVLSVKVNVTTYWAIPEDLLFSSFYLADLRLFDFAVFYIPLFAYILILLGCFTTINRKTLFFFTWGFFLFLLGSPYLTKLYDFLYQHVFFLKYFRNLHFFLWLAILPLVILFSVEQLRIFSQTFNTTNRQKQLGLGIVVLIHVAMAALLLWRQNLNISTWVVLAVSLLFFIMYLRKRLNLGALCMIYLLAVAIEPFEAYYHLGRNVHKELALSVYDQFTPHFGYTRGQKTVVVVNGENQLAAPETKSTPIYFGTSWYNLLWDNMSFNVLKNYTFNKFILYDRVTIFDEEKQDLKIVERAWEKNYNVAFVPQGTPTEVLAKDVLSKSSAPTVVVSDNKEIQVIASDVNNVKLKIDLPVKKFLVFNDGFYPGWKAYINGQETALYRANVAFKGIWVPSGEQIVEFRFGESWRHKFEILLPIFFVLFFIFFIFIWVRDTKINEARNV